MIAEKRKLFFSCMGVLAKHPCHIELTWVLGQNMKTSLSLLDQVGLTPLQAANHLRGHQWRRSKAFTQQD